MSVLTIASRFPTATGRRSEDLLLQSWDAFHGWVTGSRSRGEKWKSWRWMGGASPLSGYTAPAADSRRSLSLPRAFGGIRRTRQTQSRLSAGCYAPRYTAAVSSSPPSLLVAATRRRIRSGRRGWLARDRRQREQPQT